MFIEILYLLIFVLVLIRTILTRMEYKALRQQIGTHTKTDHYKKVILKVTDPEPPYPLDIGSILFLNGVPYIVKKAQKHKDSIMYIISIINNES